MIRRVAALVTGLALIGLGARMGWVTVFAPQSQTAWDDRTRAQLQFLSDEPETLEAHADAMQRLFPEGRLFTIALTGLAWHRIGGRVPDLAAEANRHIADAVRLAESPETRETFGPAAGLPHGMFYDAWTTHLLLAGGADSVGDSLAVRCQRLHGAFDGDALWVDSYPGQAWPADAVVGAAALSGCGRLDPTHADVARQWLGRVRRHLDPQTGLIPHDAVSPGARGSSTALMIPFLSQVDPRFALDQHSRFRKHFETNLLGVFPTMREYPQGTTGGGDVDSGPVLFGVSAPASVVGIAASRTVGAAQHAQALRATTEVLGLPLGWGEARRYAFGQLPVGDAFLAWASSVPTEPMREPPTGWRSRWGVVSVVLLGLGVLAIRYGRGGWSRARASISGQPSR